MLHITDWALTAIEKPWGAIDKLDGDSEEIFAHRKTICIFYLTLGKSIICKSCCLIMSIWRDIKLKEISIWTNKTLWKLVNFTNFPLFYFDSRTCATSIILCLRKLITTLCNSQKKNVINHNLINIHKLLISSRFLEHLACAYFIRSWNMQSFPKLQNYPYRIRPAVGTSNITQYVLNMYWKIPY